MRLPNRVHILRTVAGTLLVLTAGLALSSPAFAAGKPHPHRTPHSRSHTMPPPTAVQAVLESDGSVDLTWKATSVPASKLGGYIVDRNNQQIAQLPTDGNAGPLSYTDPRPSVGTVTYTVLSYAPSGVAGSPSLGATVDVRLAAGSSGSSGSTATPPGDITQPNFRGHNAPTAFEEYGQYVGTVNETYGITEDPFNRGLMDLLNVYWYFTTMHAFLALSFLAWGITSRFYAPLALVVSGVLTKFLHMSLFPTVVTIAILAGTAALIPWILRGRLTQLMRGFAIMVGVLALSVIGLTFSRTVVETVMNSPVAAGDYILGQVDQLMPVNENGSQYNLSIKPTFVGNPIDQEIRRFQYQEWLSTVYPSECMLNFGSVTWPTQNFVPNDVPTLGGRAISPGGVQSRFGGPTTTPTTSGSQSNAVKEGFNHLTYCEYFVRDNKFGGSEASYLESQVQQHATGQNGFIWQMYQGNDMSQHIFYAGIAMGVITVRSIYIDVLALSFVVCEFMLAVGLLKLGLLGLMAMWPPAQRYVSDVLRATYITWTIPIFGAIMAVICLVLSNAAAHFMQQYGWVWSMLAQLFIAVVVLFSFIGYWWRRHKQRKLSVHWDGSPRHGSAGKAVASATEGAAAAAAITATGGAAAPAIAAGGVGTLAAATRPTPVSAGDIPKQLPPPGGNGGSPSGHPKVITAHVIDSQPVASSNAAPAVAPSANRKALPPAKT